MRVHGYNKEKKEEGFSDVYIKAIIFGVIAALLLIGSGFGIKFLIKLLINYWYFALIGVAVIFLFRRFVLKKRNS